MDDVTDGTHHTAHFAGEGGNTPSSYGLCLYPPMTLSRSIIFFGLVFASFTSLRADAVFTSGPEQVTLLELFTSEGCSSCPPAEETLARLRDDPRLWKEVVPVAFHVTYFDSRAWRDRFASKTFTARQYDYAREWSAENVYTPCLVQNGVEFRARERTATPAQSGILRAERASDGRVRVTFQPTTDDAKARYDVYVALLGGGITLDVRGGENAGRKLVHEFVALVLREAELTAQADGTLTASVELAEKNLPATPRRALAVWVTRRGKMTPVQATGGWVE
jgi:hypothetical protein